jgi:hypothetical protein
MSIFTSIGSIIIISQPKWQARYNIAYAYTNPRLKQISTVHKFWKNSQKKTRHDEEQDAKIPRSFGSLIMEL